MAHNISIYESSIEKISRYHGNVCSIVQCTWQYCTLLKTIKVNHQHSRQPISIWLTKERKNRKSKMMWFILRKRYYHALHSLIDEQTTITFHPVAQLQFKVNFMVFVWNVHTLLPFWIEWIFDDSIERTQNIIWIF